jgi:hypothetical protein
MRYAAVSGAILLAAAGLIATYVRVPPPHIGSGSVCRTAARPLARLELLFGSTRKDLTPISEEEWAAFVAAEITPRFPDGLTILTGYGQWRDATGTIVKETSRLLLRPIRTAASRPSAPPIRRVLVKRVFCGRTERRPASRSRA